MWDSIVPRTWLSDRLLTQDGNWECHTRLCPRTRMLCDCPNDTIWSPGPKLNEPLAGSVVSHFISLPGVTMSNWVPAMPVSPPLPRSPWVSSVPRYRPSASAWPRRVDAACAGTAATMAVVTVMRKTVISDFLVFTPRPPLVESRVELNNSTRGSSRRLLKISNASRHLAAVRLQVRLHYLSAEDPALDLATVVLKGVVQVHGRGMGRRLRVAVADRLVDRGVFVDRLIRVAADRATQADRAGLVL